MKRAIAFAATLLGASGCQYRALDVDRVAVTGGAAFRDGVFVIPLGGAYSFKARPVHLGDRRDTPLDHVLELEVGDPDIAGVDMTPLNQTWIVTGRAEGATFVEVIVDGTVEEEVPIEVIEPSMEADSDE